MLLLLLLLLLLLYYGNNIEGFWFLFAIIVIQTLLYACNKQLSRVHNHALLIIIVKMF